MEKSTKQAASAPVEIARRNERKWGKEVMAAGWLAVPSVLLQRQNAFGLDPLDLNIRITRLAKDGLIERVERRASHGGNKPNIYRLTLLAEKAKPFALEMLQERQARKQQKGERHRRKRPVLRVLRPKKE